MPNKIAIPQDKVKEFCHRNHIQKLALFGSVLRDDFGSESDIDVLVEFEPGAGVGFFELYDMEKELSRMFVNGKVKVYQFGELKSVPPLPLMVRFHAGKVVMFSPPLD
ncbi:MAG: nucleotidyltransferase domain-containing protein [Candidatus Omnitrophica bacterium]|nr:nucleotidyltransferase domain-containing protein [Candidatus Omnitrophota bacterium]